MHTHSPTPDNPETPEARDPSGTLVLGDEHTYRGQDRTSAQWWLLDTGGEAVAYIQVIHNTGPRSPYDPELMICDIEVRPDLRGRGWARAIITAVEAHYGQTLHTSGSFTPLGFAALAGHIPCAPGAQEGVSFRDMTFVTDWAAREPKHFL